MQEIEEKERLRAVLESLETKLAAITTREEAKELADANAKKEKAPIRFKDAVGRKFSFPFHICATWTGIEELIKQAFLHVDVIGPHVQAGHYDLLGPDGQIILPQIWDKVIEPDWAISMHMWPMERRPDPLMHHAYRGPPGALAAERSQELQQSQEPRKPQAPQRFRNSEVTPYHESHHTSTGCASVPGYRTRSTAPRIC
ncbi:hypothetical protein PG987_008170 [Apiospora arundinis]